MRTSAPRAATRRPSRANSEAGIALFDALDLVSRHVRAPGQISDAEAQGAALVIDGPDALSACGPRIHVIRNVTHGSKMGDTQDLGREPGRRIIPAPRGRSVSLPVLSAQAGRARPRHVPLIMRLLPVSTGGCASFRPGTGAPRGCQSSLGYEQYDACLWRLAASLVGLVALADRVNQVALGRLRAPSHIVPLRPVYKSVYGDRGWTLDDSEVQPH